MAHLLAAGGSAVMRGALSNFLNSGLRLANSAQTDSFMPGQKRSYTKTPNDYKHCADGTTVIFIQRKNGQTFECLIDTSDFELVKSYRWRIAKQGRNQYAVTSTENRNRVNLAKILCPDCDLVLYGNYDGLDNRRSNLIPGTQSLKSIHKRKHKRLTSKFKGVHKFGDKFRAIIQADGECSLLGSFNSEIEAAACYNEEAKKRFGELAYLNDIPEGKSCTKQTKSQSSEQVRTLTHGCLFF